MSAKSRKDADQQEAITRLREWLKPGETVYTSLESVSRSGMSRKIGVHYFYTDEKGEIVKLWLTRLVATACGFRFDYKSESLVIGGCGMDMGFHVVYTLGRVLFPDGFGTVGTNGAIRDLRPQSKELAEKAVACGYSFHGRNGDASGWDTDGGYALKQRWI